MQTLLFNRDAVEDVPDWPPDVHDLGRSSIMWIDLDQPSTVVPGSWPRRST